MIKDFINQAISEIVEPGYLIVDKPSDINIYWKFLQQNLEDSIIYSSDSTNIKGELLLAKNFTWNSLILRGRVFLEKSNLDSLKIIFDRLGRDMSAFQSVYGYGYCELSIPLFTSDYQTCIIYRVRRCGIWCGDGVFLIYRRKNQIWKHYKTFLCWIS